MIIVFSCGYSEVVFRIVIYLEVIGLIVYNNVYIFGECDKLYYFIKYWVCREGLEIGRVCILFFIVI